MKKGLKFYNTSKKAGLLAMSCIMMTSSLVVAPAIMPTTSVQAAFPTANNSNVSINAQAGIVIDFETGEILYAKNEKQMLDPASISKIMTNYIVFEEIAAGNLSYDTVITVSRYAASICNTPPYNTGDKVTLRNLIELMLVPSSSGSCVAIAEHISGSEAAFVQRMNETAQRLGIDAVYKQSHGSQNFPTNAVSVESQALLIKEFITRFPEVLDFTSLRSTSYKGRTYKSTNLFYSSIPYAGVDGFKTGTTTSAGYCFSGTITRDGRRLISVVLKSNSGTNRYYDTKKIIDNSYSLIANNSVIYDGIGTSVHRELIEDFYETGYSPYAKGTTYPLTTLVKTNDLLAILDKIVADYDLHKKTIINITPDTNYALTPATAYNIIKQHVPITRDAVDSFYITGEEVTQFDHIALAKTVFDLLEYLDTNSKYFVRNSDLVEGNVVLETPKAITLPFEFKAYNEPNLETAEIASYPSETVVEVVSVADNNFWNVNIDGKNCWINTNGKAYYSLNHKVLYEDSVHFNVVGGIAPQFLFIEEDFSGKDYVSIESWLGEVRIDTALLK